MLSSILLAILFKPKFVFQLRAALLLGGKNELSTGLEIGYVTLEIMQMT